MSLPIPHKDGMFFTDCLCSPFTLYGLIPPTDENGVFQRLPEQVAKACNDGVAQLNLHTAGGRVTFVTDSAEIAIDTQMHTISKMSHMALTGSTGFDLYEKKCDTYTYRGTFQPPFDIEEGFSSSLFVGEGGEREYVINFPLYSGVKRLYIGLKDGSTLSPASSYKLNIPVVYYGSSITQGGCASRPGNSYQAIISRHFDCDYINLGFSGSAKGEPAIRTYIADLKMSVFVCDYEHNAPDEAHLLATLPPLINEFREKQPNTPVIMLSRPQIYLNESEARRRDIVQNTYLSHKNNGDDNIYFIDGSQIMKRFSTRDSGSVDGCHPNDLGFMCMAQAIIEVLEQIVNK